MTGINRNPGGLLGFLGIKNFGRNPQTLTEQLAGTWDLADLYLSAACIQVEYSSSFAAAGKQMAFQVPRGEYWYVRNFSCRTDVMGFAGGSLAIAIAIQSQSTLVTLNVGPTSGVITQPSGRAAAYLERPIILQPGESIGAYVLDFNTAGAVVNAYSIRYAVLPA